MTAEELMKLMSPSTLVSLYVDLVDSDGTLTWEEAVIADAARRSAAGILGTERYDQWVSREIGRRNDRVRSVR